MLVDQLQACITSSVEGLKARAALTADLTSIIGQPLEVAAGDGAAGVSVTFNLRYGVNVLGLTLEMGENFPSQQPTLVLSRQAARTCNICSARLQPPVEQVP